MIILVGENGTGKTRLFEAMIDGLRQAPPWADAAVVNRVAGFGSEPGL